LNEVVWTDPALDHLETIQVYIEQFNPRAARDVAEGLKAAGNSLVNFPHRGRLVRGTDMRELVTAYPYIIRYRVVGNDVVILRIRHTARRPTNP
jgi:toxin ParE1/3/4